MTVTLAASATQTATVTTEHTLAALEIVGEFQLVVDTVNMVAGDVLELRIKRMVLTGGTVRVALFTAYYGAQPVDDLVKISGKVPHNLTDADSITFTLKQTFGTGREFPWAVLQHDNTTNIAVTGTGLTAIPWNAAWDAEVQSEATDALVAYDPPTQAEMDARTLAAASYATAAALTTAQTDISAILVDTSTTLDDFIDTEIATIITDIAAVKVDTAAILVDTGTTLDTAIADLPTNAELATSQAAADDATLAAIAAILTTAMTESYAADGATMTMAQFAYQIWALLAEASVTTTTLTARKLDGTTAAATFTLNDATSPTSITRAT